MKTVTDLKLRLENLDKNIRNGDYSSWISTSITAKNNCDEAVDIAKSAVALLEASEVPVPKSTEVQGRVEE